MYRLKLDIPEGVYDYLVKWGLSNGYEVETNEDHTILYALENRDPIVDLKAWKQGTASRATKVEATVLIANLAHVKENEAIPYAPIYCPQIRVHEEMYSVIKGIRNEKNWTVEADHEGVFWFIKRVREEGASDIMCRSEVAAFIRSLEYKRRIAPFSVIRQHGTQSIWWESRKIDSLKKALEVVEKQKPRHAPFGNWKVWEDVTEEAGAMPAPAVMESEAGFMVRGWFPGEVGGDYCEKEYYDQLIDALIAIVRMQEFEPDAVCAVYACRHHEPLEEEKQEAIQPIKPEDCPICWRVWKMGSMIANGFGQEDDPEAVAESVKSIMTSGIAPGMDNAVFHDPPFKILVYRLATVLEVEA